MYGSYLTGKKETSTKTPSRASSSRGSSKSGSSGIIQVQGYMNEIQGDIQDAISHGADVLARYALQQMEDGSTNQTKLIANINTALNGFTPEQQNQILVATVAKMIANG
jgi:hypothetical protein